MLSFCSYFSFRVCTSFCCVAWIHLNIPKKILLIALYLRNEIDMIIKTSERLRGDLHLSTHVSSMDMLEIADLENSHFPKKNVPYVTEVEMKAVC